MDSPEPTSASELNLARAILRHGSPNVARELYELTIASEDPEDYRKYLELVNKLEGKDESAGGAPVHITIDLGGAAPAIELVPQTTAEPHVDAVEVTPTAIPAPEAPQPAPAGPDPDIAMFDLSALLGDD